MFKNKREFAQALLDGRKFKIRHPGSGILDSDIIKNRGDMILVSNENVPLKVEREFIMLYDNKWVCKIPNESNRLFAWRSAEAI